MVHACGYTPYVGFIHSGSPLPFVYDISDIYKSQLCIDLAFKLSAELGGQYDRKRVSQAFREKVLEIDLLGRAADDIEYFLGG